MMAGNPNNWWSTMVNAGNNMDPPPHPPPQSPPSHHENPHFYGPSVSLADETMTTLHFPRPFNPLIMGGLGVNENEKFGVSHFQYKNKVVQENWEDHQIGMNNPSSSSSSAPPPAPPDADDVVKEDGPFPRIGQFYGHDHRLSVILEHDDHRRHYFQSEPPALSSPPHHHRQTRSHYDEPPGKNKTDDDSSSRHSYECNSTSTGSGGGGGASNHNKKARLHNNHHHSSTQPSLKVRKEKLADRITALHQLVSPFGKTDTASVLSEVIGYVTFLHSQIQALSSPYFGNASRRSMAHIHQQSERGGEKDLRSKGLCLVPLSCTQHVSVGGGGGCTFDGVNFNNGGPAADYWAPLGGGF